MTRKSEIRLCACKSRAQPEAQLLTCTDARLQACYSVAAGVEAFDCLQRHDQKLGEAAWLQHWSTHPTTAARQVAIRGLIPKMLHGSPCHYEQEFRDAMAAVAAPPEAQRVKAA